MQRSARMRDPKSTALARYSASLGILVERGMTQAALQAARQRAEREAAEARAAKREIETAAAALREEIAIRLGTQSRLAFLASHDPLTALPNRTLLNERLVQAIAEARASGTSLALHYVDLDDFKTVNDTFGHAVGDALLQQVAGRIERQIRPGETVARMGGDEFAILQVGLRGAQEAKALADRVIARMGQPFEVDAHQVFIGASIGVTLFPEDGVSAELLHRNADLAMYQAKGEGRNRCHFFDDTLNRKAKRRALLEQALREPSLIAQLELVYQPQVHVATRHVTGVEALLRWQHPTFGAVPPEEFIPLAEHSGMISAIGTWVLEESCRQAARWRQLGLPRMSIAVNVATAQFRDTDIPAIVESVLKRTGLPASWLELEITETGIMRDMHVAAETLVALHQLGVGLAIDDFGTGYSSLSYLRKLPVDRIKIDRSFVNDVTTNEDAAVVATTIVNLAHSLRLEVVAEGVESAEQAEFMARCGCDIVQGFFFGSPMGAAEVARLLPQAPDAAAPAVTADAPAANVTAAELV
ncbi:MAG: EAL domain-containing protein [Acidisphaera sp.]|nr:EAL domain-containing protein [Acidisphaera sp.]